MVAALSTRNPLYVVLILLVATSVDRATARFRLRRLPFRPLPLALLGVVTGGLLNALSAHVGETPLVHLPDWLPLLGGDVTLEALAWGATSGLTLGTIYALFYVFNQLTSVDDLMRVSPRAFHEAGLVLSIALTFVPETTRAFERIREAQAVRGHELRRARDVLPIVVPLVVGSLERSTGLAEAMVARGYGAVGDRAQPARLRALLAVGLIALLAGWLTLGLAPIPAASAAPTATTPGVAGDLLMSAIGARPLAWVAIAGGAAAILAVLRLAGLAAPRTSYRPTRWAWPDLAVALACGLSLLCLFVLAPPDALYYSPYPRLALPDFDAIVGLALLALLAPAFLLTRQPAPRDGAARPSHHAPSRP
jgi:energy-coupling factor transport system permease protein